MLIDTNEIDNTINKLSELKANLNDIKDIVGDCAYLSTKDVARILGVSEQSAREYMSRPDFPLLRVGKSFKVCSWAFLIYNMQART